jgi:hypothetical protein
MTTISKFHTGFINAMVQSAYRFDAAHTKTIDEPPMSDRQLRDFYCAFCGCTEQPMNEPFCYPLCPQCKAT